MKNEENELLKTVKEHLLQYPLMQPQDLIKLLYQRNYGPEHNITDPARSLQQLKEEAQEVKVTAEGPLFISIGNAYVRLNLDRALHEYTVEQINDMFVRSAGVVHGSMSQYLEDIKFIQKNFGELKADFTQDDFNEYLSWYRSQAYPAVHHTPVYRQTYAPHYRVVFNKIWNTLEEPLVK
jgi:hypothetical protein